MPVSVWQGSLQGVTFGTGTNYHFASTNISGLGVPSPKANDVNLTSGDGAYAGADLKGVRVIVIPYIVLGTSPTNAMDNFETLAAAWEPVASDVTLELYLPGKHVTIAGRPRGLVEDLSALKSSRVAAIGTFVALDPTMTNI